MHMDSYEIVTLKTPKAVRDEVEDKVEETPQEDESAVEEDETEAIEGEQENEGADKEEVGNVNTWEKYATEHLSSDNDDSLIVSFQFEQGKEGKYNDTDMLLDTGSTVSVIKNKKMLIDIRDSKQTLQTYTNGGH